MEALKEVAATAGGRTGRSNGNMITPGCAVLLDINNGDKLIFAHLNKNASVQIGNTKCWLDALIGHSFGSVFEVQSSPKDPSFVRMSPSAAEVPAGETAKVYREAGVDDGAKSKDNRALIDNNMAQTLSAEDISKMRNEGVSGKAIMEALVANSATFQSKTAFSQEKYLRKKQKKYAPRVVVRSPSARSVCEAYFAKDPNKIGFLRMDMLALILSLANVGANAEVLVFDMLGGLLTASVAERLGGYGSVCSTYHMSKPQTIDMVRLFNFDASTSSRVVRAPVSQLIAARTAKPTRETDGEAGKPSAPVEIPDVPSKAQPMETMEITQVEEKVIVYSRIKDAPGGEPEHSAKRRAFSKTDDSQAGKSMKAGRPASEEDMGRWGKEGFSSLIVGALYVDPWTVAEKLLPLLASSAPFVIYHPYVQPLAECMSKLQSERMAVALQLQEPWLREYQVLPLRTHPNMQMSSTGGWVLSGIRITKA